jgi:hypothetical protein
VTVKSINQKALKLRREVYGVIALVAKQHFLEESVNQ